MFTDSVHLVSHDVWSDRLTNSCFRRLMLGLMRIQVWNQGWRLRCFVPPGKSSKDEQDSTIYIVILFLSEQQGWNVRGRSLVYSTINFLKQTSGACESLYLYILTNPYTRFALSYVFFSILLFQDLKWWIVINQNKYFQVLWCLMSCLTYINFWRTTLCMLKEALLNGICDTLLQAHVILINVCQIDWVNSSLQCAPATWLQRLLCVAVH